MNRLFDVYEADLAARHGRASAEKVRLRLKNFLCPSFGRLVADSIKTCPWVFIYRGRRLREPQDGFRAVAESAGYPNALLHDLRGTAIRNMEGASIPRAEAMQISGHPTESVYKRYDSSSERGAIRAGEVLAEQLSTLDAQATQPSQITHMPDQKIEMHSRNDSKLLDFIGADERT